jgi:hypothetical protein
VGLPAAIPDAFLSAVFLAWLDYARALATPVLLAGAWLCLLVELGPVAVNIHTTTSVEHHSSKTPDRQGG